ncbi:MAG: sugar porter family MFS transporter [Actinomycetia bacterium]|nr:sugar porter family MFS transporter [Actinomycetes bacterium]
MTTTANAPTRAIRGPNAAKWVTLAAATLGIVYGYDQSNIGGAQLYAQPDLEVSNQVWSFIAASVVYGELTGVIIGGWLVNKISRRNTMIVVAAGYVIFCLASALSVDTFMLEASRYFLGVTIGLSLIAAPVFIAESVPSATRGRTLVMYQLATVFGVILGFVGALLLSQVNPEYNWRIMLGLAAIPAALLLPVLVKLPKTARWLMLKGREDEARRSLLLIEPDRDPEEELAIMRAAMAEETGGALKEMFSKPYFRATVFVVVLGFLVQITGINATITYGPAIFQQMGIESDAMNTGMNALVQVIAFIAVLFAMRYIDNWGRRPVLLTGISIMIAAQLLLVLVFASAGEGGSFSTWQDIGGFLGLAFINVGFVIGFGSLWVVYSTESFPARLRSLGASFMLTANLAANILVAQFFLTIMDELGGAGSFAIFALLAAFAWVFVFKVAPETKGRDLDDIRLFWENGGKWPKDQMESADLGR